MRDQVEAFNRDKNLIPLRVDRWDDERNFEKFIDGKWNCEVLYHRVMPSGEEASVLRKRWPEGVMQPEAFFVGQVRVAVIVNRANRIDHITLDQIRELLKAKGEITSWRQLGIPGRDIRPYGEGRDATSRLVIRRACMMLGPEYPTGYYNYRDDFEQLHDAAEVIEKVRRDRNGIGFFLYTGEALLPRAGIRLVPVAKSADVEPIAMKHGRFIQENYPLSEPLVLYLRPDASETARAFCHFAIGSEGREIAASHGLTTPRQHADSLAEERFAEVRAGRGPRVSVMGVMSNRSLVPDLGTEYVRARETMQLSLDTSDRDSLAIGAFVSTSEGRPNRPELLFLTGRPSDQAFALHGERWNELQPSEHLLAGRATAIIVNAANRLDALTLGQIEAIFAGDVDDWALVAPGSVTVSAEQERGNRIPINRYGLQRNDRATELFHRERVAEKHGRINTLECTKDVLAAVSIDPQAIGFVDLAAIPETGQTVKILGIKIGPRKVGERAEVVYPTPEAIRNAMYPFAERLYLYVHPQASDTTRDFAQFLVTGGASEQTRYTDPVAALTDTFRGHGLIPLSEAAVARSLQERE